MLKKHGKKEGKRVKKAEAQRGHLLLFFPQPEPEKSCEHTKKSWDFFFSPLHSVRVEPLSPHTKEERRRKTRLLQEEGKARQGLAAAAA